MGRKKIRLADDTDSDEIRNYIEEKAARSESALLKAFLQRVQTPTRLPILSPNFNQQEFSLNSFARIAAAAVHVRGEVAETPCNNCNDGNGPFRDCVHLTGFDDLTKKSCTNCQFNVWTDERDRGKRGVPSCSFAKDRPHKFRVPKIRLEPRNSANSEQNTQMSGDSEITKSALKGSLHSAQDHVHILGNLSLPRLQTDQYDLKQILDPLIKDLSALHFRDMQLLKKPIDSLEDCFEKFIAAEAKAWREDGYSRSPPREYVVKPSGMFRSPISHRLNQPSFTSNNLEDSEAADLTNGCTMMVMGTAYDRDTLLYDQIHRRSATSEGYEDYPAEVRKVHADWTRQIWESLEAKVELIYGQKALRAIMADSTIKTTPLPLWDEHSGVILHLVHEESFWNAQAGFRFRKILIFVHHPQYLFYARKGDLTLIYQDKALTVAAAIAGVRHIPDYYTDKLFPKTWPQAQERHLQTVLAKYEARGLSINLCESVHKNTSTKVSNGVEQSRWEQAFVDKSHSNTDLYKLLPEAIDATKLESGNWSGPESFPKPVLDWWKGQKQILFFKTTVTDERDIFSILQECKRQISKKKSTSDPSLLPLALQQILEIQKSTLEGDGRLKIQEAALCHSRFDGRPVRISCPQCKKEGKPSQSPLYSINKSGHFVTYRRSTCKGCGGRYGFTPLDPDIPWCGSGPATLQSTATANHFGEGPIHRVLKTPTMLTPQEKRPVELVCLQCHDEGEADERAYTDIDENPRWTLGNNRPLYFECQKYCRNCIRIKRVSGRWIPKDAAIPSIGRYTLKPLAELYGHFDPFIVASLLDHWPPSSRQYRLRKND